MHSVNKICFPVSLVFLVCLFSLSSCKNENEPNEEKGITADIVTNPATASGNAEEGTLPVFSFEEETHDFGKIVQGEKVSYNFKFKNSGKSDLLISNASASCGCTVPEYSKNPIAPGGEGVITVTFDSAGKEGKISKTVTVTANTVPNTKVLTITCEINLPEKK